jgi:hypothetical protein
LDNSDAYQFRSSLLRNSDKPNTPKGRGCEKTIKREGSNKESIVFLPYPSRHENYTERFESMEENIEY